MENIIKNNTKKNKIKKIKKNKTKKELKIITILMNYISSNKNLKCIFNHHRQKYKLDELFKIVLFILKTGISYRNITELNTDIHWNTIYKFVKKLEKYKIIEEIYRIQSISYVTDMKNPTKYLKTDTSFILNKYGIPLLMMLHIILKLKNIKL